MQALGLRMDPRTSRAICRDQPQKSFLLLEQHPQGHEQQGPGGFQELALPRLLGAGDLGTGTGRSKEDSGSMVVLVVDVGVSRDLLLFLSRRPLSASRRARI